MDDHVKQQVDQHVAQLQALKLPPGTLQKILQILAGILQAIGTSTPPPA